MAVHELVFCKVPSLQQSLNNLLGAHVRNMVLPLALSSKALDCPEREAIRCWPDGDHVICSARQWSSLFSIEIILGSPLIAWGCGCKSV